MTTGPIPQMEIPETIRSLTRASVEQARKAYDLLVDASQKMASDMGNALPGEAAGGVRSLNEKIAEFAKANVEANFQLAENLTEAKDIQSALQLQSDHMRKQMEAFSVQTRELGEMMMKLVQDLTKR